MGKTWTIRPSPHHEAIRKQLGATPTDFCKRALDAFCKDGSLQQERLRKLCGSVKAGKRASSKEGFHR